MQVQWLNIRIGLAIRGNPVNFLNYSLIWEVYDRLFENHADCLGKLILPFVAGAAIYARQRSGPDRV